MKMKFFYSLALIAIASFASCDKDKENNNDNGGGGTPETPVEPTTVTIGDKAYPIVKIGTQSWTGANYSGAGGDASPTAPSTQYGKVYTYAEVSAITPPAGWRLPTKDDYINLLKSQGAEFGADNKTTNVDAIRKVISASGWTGGVQGTNSSNFNAFPAGYYHGFHDYEGAVTVFWTSSKATGNDPYFFSISSTEAGLFTNTITNEMFSIRFIKAN